MKKSLIVSRKQTLWAQAALTVLLALALTGAFWFATLPVALSDLITPTEMIAAGLPPGAVIKTADKPQFLTAVCAAIKQHRKSAAAITGTAVRARHEYGGDIVATAVRCSNGERGECELTGAIVAAAISAWPDSAPALDDAAVAVAPDCADAIQSATANDGREVLPSGEPRDNLGPRGLIKHQSSMRSEAEVLTNSQEPTVLICDNDRQRAIRAGQVNHYLNSHPGSFVGNCMITPATSR